jgi:transposase
VEDFPLDRLVFLDESSASTSMARFRGWGLRGQRVIGSLPHGHYKTQTMIAGIRLSGPVAPFVFDGALDGEVFRVWAQRCLLPELSPGDIVIADNLSSHKTAAASGLIVSAGCRLLFLPPYSPDYNPIENMWSKIKECLRSLAARELPALYNAIATAFERVTPDDCRGFFKHCGYST